LSVRRRAIHPDEPTAYSHTARGGIHDEPALAEAVKSGGIAGPVWMFSKEHLISITRVAYRNVIVTPHNAGMTAESILEMVTATAHSG